MKSGFCWRPFVASILFILSFVPAATAQTGTFSGVVLDGDFGDPLIGANVVLKGTLLGTSTDLDGRFRIDNVPAGIQTFEISYIGFQTLTV